MISHCQCGGKLRRTDLKPVVMTNGRVGMADTDPKIAHFECKRCGKAYEQRKRQPTVHRHTLISRLRGQIIALEQAQRGLWITRTERDCGRTEQVSESMLEHAQKEFDRIHTKTMQTLRDVEKELSRLNG